MSVIKLPEHWNKRLGHVFESEQMQQLMVFLQQEKRKGKTIFPPEPEIFSAFHQTDFTQVKVIIIGQDPYHGDGEAHGLCFSAKKGIRVPPSLKNIYKEISHDLKLTMPIGNGSLIPWAMQGVLLLNSVLTVEKDTPASHRGKGWEYFTDEVIKCLNEEKENLVFMLWGKDAQKKGQKIDRKKHLVLESGHPSPFSAHLFLGQKHFSKCNHYLEEHGLKAIDWHLNEVP